MGYSFETMLANLKNKKPESRSSFKGPLDSNFFIMKAYLAAA